MITTHYQIIIISFRCILQNQLAFHQVYHLFSMIDRLSTLDYTLFSLMFDFQAVQHLQGQEKKDDSVTNWDGRIMYENLVKSNQIQIRVLGISNSYLETHKKNHPECQDVQRSTSPNDSNDDIWKNHVLHNRTTTKNKMADLKSKIFLFQCHY